MIVCEKCDTKTRKPFFGKVELENGIVLNWLRFTETEQEAIRLVRASFVHVKQIWFKGIRND